MVSCSDIVQSFSVVVLLLLLNNLTAEHYKNQAYCYQLAVWETS